LGLVQLILDSLLRDNLMVALLEESRRLPFLAFPDHGLIKFSSRGRRLLPMPHLMLTGDQASISAALLHFTQGFRG